MRHKNFEKDKLHILIISAFNLAIKTVGESKPTLNQILQVTKYTEIESKIDIMEYKISNTIEIDKEWPTIWKFKGKIAKLANFKTEKQLVANMLCEFMLVDSKIL